MNFATTSVTLPFKALLVTAALVPAALAGAPAAESWAFWQPSTPTASLSVDHAPWQRLLTQYVDTEHPSGINRFDYAVVSEADRASLTAYLATLGRIDPRELNRNEQYAFWINLYNALTVDLVLTHYPVDSIRDIGGWLSTGPWDRELIEVAGQALTLNDIEHRILRPIWRDPRIHYAVNCASLGCPNLAALAYTASNVETLLEQQAIDYVNHRRGVAVEGDRLTLSRIFDWYAEDFGDSRAELISHLHRYADERLARNIVAADGRIRYQYDWALNKP
jgi:hypothetical protein